MTASASVPPPLPSFARDADHAAEIAAHWERLCDEAPPLSPRMEYLLRSDSPMTETADNAA